MGMALKGAFISVALIAFSLITWLLILAREERPFVRNYLKIAQAILTGKAIHDSSNKH